MAHPAGGLFQQLQQERLFQYQQQGIIPAPEHKIPACPVPQAGEQPHHGDIENLPGQPLAVAPQGDVHILLKPGGQRDVPAPPEFRDTGADIGIVEILQKLEAEHPPQADGHIRIAGEIEVDLQAIGCQTRPGCQCALGLPQNFPQAAHGIGQQHLLGQAHQEPGYPGGKLGDGLLPVLQHLGHIRIADNGPGNQLREKGHVGAEGERIPLHRGILPVDIDDIAHGLEYVEGDADGQGQLGKPGAEEESSVLKKRQKPQIQHDAQGQGGAPPAPPAALPGNFQTAQIVHYNGGNHQRQIRRLPPAVKGQAEQQQHRIPPPPGAQVVQRQHRRKEGKQENIR